MPNDIMFFKFKIIRRIIKRRRGNKSEYIAHKNIAKEIAEVRIKHFNAFYQFKVGRISIKNQKTRWGSCSKKGNLNFNYKIAILPIEFADYIIVHELCHLGQFNHSPAFWDLVAKTIPNYKNIKKEFKKIRL